jgi:TnpA family transposase
MLSLPSKRLTCGFPRQDLRDLWNLRASGFGGIAFRLRSDTYIALFSHFIPCGVWEAVYILDSLLANESDVQPDQIHADTQGQSLPVFGLAALPRRSTGTSTRCSAIT